MIYATSSLPRAPSHHNRTSDKYRPLVVPTYLVCYLPNKTFIQRFRLRKAKARNLRPDSSGAVVKLFETLDKPDLRVLLLHLRLDPMIVLRYSLPFLFL